MRIADNMRFDTVQRSLSALRSRQAVLTGQISSGSKIAAPSDDPAAAWPGQFAIFPSMD